MNRLANTSGEVGATALLTAEGGGEDDSPELGGGQVPHGLPTAVDHRNLTPERPVSRPAVSQTVTPPVDERRRGERRTHASQRSTDQRDCRERAGSMPRPAPAPNTAQPRPKGKKKVGASIRLATENIRGRGAPKIAGSLRWKALADDIRRYKIGIMAIQETHMTEEHVSEVHQFYSHLRMVNTSLPDNPTGAGGVAIIFNKTLTNSQEIEHRVLIPGRAIVAKIKWNRDDDLVVMAVYAPTRRAENHSMWESLHALLLSEDYDLPMPDVLLGDFNFVEDALDRYPARISPMDAPTTFSRLKILLQMSDGWRTTFPDATEWTWRSNDRAIMSRIDRVYLTKRTLMTSRNWRTELSGLTPDDHSRVSLEIVNPDMPTLGPGRWAMPASMIRDAGYMEAVDARCKRALEEMEAGLAADPSGSHWTPESSPQAIWATLKKDLAQMARQRLKESAGKRSAALAAKLGERDAIRSTLTAAADPATPETLASLAAVERSIQTIKESSHKRIFANRDARTWAEAEKMTKSWFRWTKTKQPRETLTALRHANSEPPTYATNSAAMARLAQDYHDGIQTADIDEMDSPDGPATMAALAHVRRHLTPRAAEDVALPISYEEVIVAIKESKPGSAAGLDGLVYELWKELLRRYEASARSDERTFDVAAAMTLVFRDIESHGVAHGTHFAQGWLCPLYKKGERTEIANYRPITLLNTDYKLLTKAISTRLAKVAPDLIHHAQAGFIRGRSITAHSKISSLILPYAELTGENGMVVALDQEKAYDKVRHDYLYAVLARFHFPQQFIDLVRSLYAEAETRVIINGVKSKGYRVTRGVRQGDPLSCLLFNLAIEPLAEMLRCSDIRGYDIPGLTEKLVATLYADDTTVYLSAQDSYDALQSLLKEWCRASGAKFNIKKTEIIPLGTAAFRAELIASRRLSADDARIPDGIRIANDGETTRILGTWPGNCVKTAAAWSLVKDKIADRLDRWEAKHPTLNGRSLLSHTIVGGMTQYLTAAQGMPARIERDLDSAILDFFWGHARRRPVNMHTLRLPKHAGGAAVVHIAARNDAQYLTWLSEYLAPPSERPVWTFLADVILRQTIIQKDAKWTPLAHRTNPFEQSWKPNVRRLPFILQCMVKTARRYQLTLDAPVIPLAVRENRHIWSHPALLEADQWRGTGWKTRCLRVHHEVATVADLEEIAELDDGDHSDHSGCICENCSTDRAHGCKHPHKCQQVANEIIGAIAEKWNPSSAGCSSPGPLALLFAENRSSALEAGELLVFDGGATGEMDICDLYRVCVDSLALTPKSAWDTIRAPAPPISLAPAQRDSVAVHAVICAAVRGATSEDSKAGFAIHYPDAEFPDKAESCAKQPGSYVGAMCLAILSAVHTVPSEYTLHIVTPAKAVVTALTTALAANVASGWLAWPDCTDELRTVTAALRARAGETTFMHVSRQRTRDWPEVTETRAAAKAAAATPGGVHLTDGWLAEFDTPGISVRGLTQQTAHRAIRHAAELRQEPRWPTLSCINDIKRAVEASYGTRPTTMQIWRSLRSHDFSRKTRNFMWKTIHGAHKVGQYFANMPEPWRSKKDCPTCHTEESMSHILFTCQDSGQSIVWDLARHSLSETATHLPTDLGGALGVALARLSDGDGKRDHAAERKLRMVVSEAIFLIWKLRCKRRIEHADSQWRHSRQDVQDQWNVLIASRKAQEQFSSRTRRRKKNAGDGGGSVGPTSPRASPPSSYAAFSFGPGVLVSPDPEGRAGVG